MRAKKIIGRIHLWFGLSSGLLIFIIAITGCIYAFQEEIQNATQKYRFVDPMNKTFLPPSEIRRIADAQVPGKQIHAVIYQGRERAVRAIYYSSEDTYYYFAYVNPYTGSVLKIKDVNAGFFSIILDGHFYLWLPPQIGQPVVATTTLIFCAMLITGLFLWWPRNKNAKKQRFRIKWNTRWKRKNYDMHSVIGFYISWIAIIFALTGLTWGFQWFRDAMYATASGGRQFLEYEEPLSDTTALINHDIPAIDKVWLQMQKNHSDAQWIEIHVPETPEAPIAANSNPDASTYWKTDYRYFDQYTLAELQVEHIWGRFHDASSADKLMRMNYDIHVGGILGFPGKILAFSVSLLVASLPVTGFLLYLGRKKQITRLSREEQYQNVTKQIRFSD